MNPTAKTTYILLGAASAGIFIWSVYFTIFATNRLFQFTAFMLMFFAALSLLAVSVQATDA